LRVRRDQCESVAIVSVVSDGTSVIVGFEAWQGRKRADHGAPARLLCFAPHPHPLVLRQLEQWRDAHTRLSLADTGDGRAGLRQGGTALVIFLPLAHTPAATDS
jgi:hypothetical protein